MQQKLRWLWLTLMTSVFVFTVASIITRTNAYLQNNDTFGASTVLTAPQGGTGISTYQRGDILVATSSNRLVALADGATGTVLMIGNDGVPAYSPSSTAFFSSDVVVGTSTKGGNIQYNGQLGTEMTRTFKAGDWIGTNGWSTSGSTQLVKISNTVIGTITGATTTTVPTVGTTYKVEIVMSATGTTAFTYTYGGVAGRQLTLGKTTDYITAQTAGLLIISGAALSVGVVESVTIKPLDPMVGMLEANGDIQLAGELTNPTRTGGITIIPSGTTWIRGAIIMIGAISGATTISMAGALSGVTTLAMSSVLTAIIPTLFVPTIASVWNAGAVTTGVTAALIPVQYSPSQRFLAYGWDLNDSANRFQAFRNWVEPYVGNTVNARLKWENSTSTTGTEDSHYELMSLSNDGEFNVLGSTYGPEVLTDPSFTNGTTSWNNYGGVNSTSGVAIYNHNALGGGLTQVSASLTTPLLPNRWYRFLYTTATSTITVRAFIDTTTTAAERIYLPGITPAAGVGKQQITFKTNSAPTDFKIVFTSAVGIISIDNLSLREIQSGNVVANGKYTGGGLLGLKINGAGTATFDGAIYTSNTAYIGTDVVVNGSSVCLSTGVNCPASGGAPTLQAVTNAGSYTTTTAQFFGGFVAASSSVTGTLSIAGSLQVTGTATSTFAGAVSSTVFYAQDGSSGVAAYSFTNQPNMGIYRAAGNILGFSSNGLAMSLSGTALTFGNGIIPQPTTDNLYTLGLSTKRFSVGFFGNLGSLAVPVGQIYASTTVGVASDALAVTGTTRLAGQVTLTSGITVPGTMNGVVVAATNQLQTNAIYRSSPSQTTITSGATVDAATNVGISLGSYRQFLTAGARPVTFYNGTGEMANFDINGVFKAVSGTSIGVGLLPLYNNSVDIGSPALSWGNIYASGTAAFAGRISAAGLWLPSGGNILTNGVNSFATLTLSGGSGAITTTAPIPTSTTIIAGGFPMNTYEMNASSTNCIYWGPTYIRDAWDGSTMNPRIQWQNASGTGSAIWYLRAESVVSAAYIGAPFTGAKSYATGTASMAYFVANNNMTSLSVGGATTGTAMKFELCREGGHGQDTLGASAYPNSVVIEYGLSAYSD